MQEKHGFSTLHPEFTFHESGWPIEVRTGFSYTTLAGVVINVGAGFSTDLASIPRMFWRVWPPFGRYTLAAIVHDWLYSECDSPALSRKAADAVFLEAMERLGVNWVTRRAFHAAVRVGGGAAYTK